MNSSIDTSKYSKNHLCDECKPLILHEGRLVIEQPDLRLWLTGKLGPVSRLHDRKSCPLCRLIALSYRVYLDQYTDTIGEDVTLGWYNAMFKISPQKPQVVTIKYITDDIGVKLPAHKSNFSQCRLLNGSQIDISKLTKWITNCEKEHCRQCDTLSKEAESAPELRSIRDFRLIDTLDQCIVESSILENYLTLSYVWRSINAFRLRRAKLAQLMTKGSLVAFHSELPRTILDAIHLTRLLGERYIWIDSLCLLEDDPQDLANGIQSMDVIYERSYLTIVAANGDDAEAGLPRLRSGSCSSPQIIEEVLPGVRLAAVHNLGQYLKNSKYYTRGWTFQELHLSRRCLVFVHDQVYFKCRDYIASWREDILLEDGAGLVSACYPDNYNASDLTELLGALRDPWKALDILLQYYGVREFTDEADALNAMAGFLRRFETRMGCPFLLGLPRATLNFHILFICKHDGTASQRKAYGISPTTPRRRNFPSYTWAGWRRTVFCPREFLSLPQLSDIGPWFTKWLEKCTWIKFYILKPSGITEEAWDFAKPRETGALPDYHMGGSLNISPPPFKLPNLVTHPTTLPQGSMRPYPMLQFWTMTARYTIIATDNQYRADLYSRDGELCGEVCLDDTLESDVSEPQEFLILSKATRARESKVPEAAKRFLGDSIVKVNRNGEWAGWDYFYVMLIKRDADGVAERRGIGRVSQLSLVSCYDPGPKWKEIILG